MDKQKLKRIVAREGLILLLVIAICLSYSVVYLFIKGRGGDNIVVFLSASTFLIAYPIRALISFIIWAVSTLREGK